MDDKDLNKENEEKVTEVSGETVDDTLEEQDGIKYETMMIGNLMPMHQLLMITLFLKIKNIQFLLLTKSLHLTL